MQTNRRMGMGWKGHRVTCTLLTAVLIGLVTSATAQAAPIIVSSSEDTVSPGFFTLNFGKLGGATSGLISATDYELEVDPQAGTARLVEYYQEVDALTLPGGFSTGDIVVELVAGSSTGSYDELTRTFETSESYAIYFSGDLSAFGLVSPVILPSTSVGTIQLNGRRDGRIDLEWAGQGELANPFDPDNPLEFSYTCEVNTVFAAQADLLIRLGLQPDVRALVLHLDVESRLLRQLETAARRIDNGWDRSAVRALGGFANMVAEQIGWTIDEDDGQALINGARAAIAILHLSETWDSK